MIVENFPVGSSKSKGIVESAIRSVQGMIRTIRNSLEEECGEKIGIVHHLALDCRACRIPVVEGRSRSRRMDGV